MESIIQKTIELKDIDPRLLPRKRHHIFLCLSLGQLGQHLLADLVHLGPRKVTSITKNDPIPMKRIGVRDTFAESGPYLEVIDKYGLTAPHIANAVRKVVARKGQP